MFATIRKAIDIKAPMAHVWKYIGTDAGLRQWWQTDIVLEAKEGGYCEEHSTVYDKVYIRRGIVTAYEPPRHLALTFHPDGVAGSMHVMTISITLQEEDGVTRVIIMQQLSAAMPSQSPCATDPHGDDPSTPSTPTIVNQFQPICDAREHGGHIELPASGAARQTGSTWGYDCAWQWTPRLATLQELVSRT